MKLHSRSFLVGFITALLLGEGAAFQALAQAKGQTNDVKPAAEAKSTELSTEFPELRKQQEKLTLENGIAEQQVRKTLARLTAEKQKLELENAVSQQKFQAEIAGLQAEVEKLTKQADLLTKGAAIKDAERKARLDAELADAREKLEKAKLTNDLASAELAAKTRELTEREQELRVRAADLQVQRTEFDLQVAKLNNDLDLRVKRDLWKNRVNHDIQYTKEPFKDGVLTISDRRIALNGPIWMDTANYIAERIDYFNNQSKEYPIFIVICAPH